MEARLIRLEWAGPLRLGEAVTDALMDVARQPGVYAWHYPEAWYGRPAVHFGSSRVGMIDRFYGHVGNMMSGIDTIYKRDGSGEVEYDKSMREENYSEKIDIIFEAIKSFDIYFSAFDLAEFSDDHLYAERALISEYNKISAEGGRYFVVQYLSATRMPPYPITVENGGACDFLPKEMKRFTFPWD